MDLNAFVLISGGAILATGMWFMRTHNHIARLKRRCEQAEADVDAQLRHRHDVIPQLVEVVRGYVKQENAMIQEFMDAYRVAVSAMPRDVRLDAETVISANLQPILNTLSNLPELQSSQHFAKLRAELLDVENKLLAARRFLNLVAAEYNAALDSFPGNLIAQFMGFRPYRYFDLGVERPQVEERPQFQF